VLSGAKRFHGAFNYFPPSWYENPFSIFISYLCRKATWYALPRNLIPEDEQNNCGDTKKDDGHVPVSREEP